MMQYLNQTGLNPAMLLFYLLLMINWGLIFNF